MSLKYEPSSEPKVHRKYDSQAADELSMRPGDVLEVRGGFGGWGLGFDLDLLRKCMALSLR